MITTKHSAKYIFAKSLLVLVTPHEDVIKWKYFPRYWPFVYFDLCQNKRLSKQLWGWWFETQSRPLWRHRNDPLTSKWLRRIHYEEGNITNPHIIRIFCSYVTSYSYYLCSLSSERQTILWEYLVIDIFIEPILLPKIVA